MKVNFKYVMLAAALSMGFAGCSESNNDGEQPVVNANTHSVNVKIDVKGGTRAVGTTAIGVTPTLTDLTLFFVDNTLGVVNDVQAGIPATILAAPGQTFSNLPGGTNCVYIVGNLTNVASALISGIAAGDPEAALKAALINVQGQQGAGTPSYEHVNLYGYTAYAVAPNATSVSITSVICPAISRLEIAKVEADQTAPASDRISSFDLDGIFINNTYREIGIDNVTYGPAIAYTNTDPIWGAPATYPAAYCDQPASMTGMNQYIPGGVNARWAYYVAPAAKQNALSEYIGEVIAGVQYDAKPVIV